MTLISLSCRSLIHRCALSPLLITPQLSCPVTPEPYKICPIFRARVLSLLWESRVLIQHVESRAFQDCAARHCKWKNTHPHFLFSGHLWHVVCASTVACVRLHIISVRSEQWKVWQRRCVSALEALVYVRCSQVYLFYTHSLCFCDGLWFFASNNYPEKNGQTMSSFLLCRTSCKMSLS